MFNLEIEAPEDGKFIKGKARPIVLRKGGVFSPKSPFEREITKKAKETLHDDWRTDSYYHVEIICFFAFPKKATKKEIEENAGGFYTKKPDIDNIAKAVLDALNGVVWNDDNSVVSLTVDKFYNCFSDEKEKVIIKIKDLKND